MNITIERPTQTTFGQLRTGRVFETQGHVYIKGKGQVATAIHKNGGLMNAGETEDFADDRVVHYVTEIKFKVG
jgi:hypothetical protein